MATQLSPGVQVREIDLTNFVPVIGTSGGATVGQFKWGPVGTYTIINDSNTLAQIFGKPDDSNYVDWFSCSNFLAYADNLNIIRVVDTTSVTPALNSSVDGTGFRVDNEDHYISLLASGSGTGEIFTARYPGKLGDTLKVSLCDAATYDTWEYKYQFDFAPSTSDYANTLGASNDEIHLVVVDEDGKFSGIPGEILEKYSFLSKARDAKGLDGEPIFYGTVLNNNSNYVWYFGPPEASDVDVSGQYQVASVGGTPTGTGYGKPIITFTDDAADSGSDPQGTGATAVATLDGAGAITGVTVTNPGAGYSNSVTVTVVDSGEGATAQVTDNTGGVIGAISPVTTGSGYYSATVTITDQGSGATATANLASTGVVKTVTLNNATTTLGDGSYTDVPLTTVGGATTDATVDFTVSGGTASGLVLNDPGAGYTGTTYTGVVALDGSSDDVTVDIVIGYDLASISVDDGGEDYGTASTIDVALAGGNPDTAATAAVTTVTLGVIAEITVTGGTGALYETAPTVTITPGGSGATATATLGELGSPYEGQIIAYVVTAGGTNYGNPAVTVAPAGTGASLTATMEAMNSAVNNWGENAADTDGNPLTFYSLVEGNDGAWASSLSGGADGADASAADYIAGWDLFRNQEEVDVNLLFTGGGGGSATNRTIIRHVIDNICEQRRDCMVFFSPDLDDVLNETQSGAINNIIDFVTNPTTGVNRNTSFAVCDSGWKLQYDVFSDQYRWIPLNADLAGISARTETDYDAWWSPAGLNRGRIKNVVSLAFNPNKTSRDELYKRNINSVVSFTGEGVVLYGDRTLLRKSSAFSYINVRRLFIVLEKAISQAAKYQLFEFNDTFTRSQFVGMVEPYLRLVQAKRGIYDFKVVCDESNNTPEVIDRAEFVASIFIKPARSINFITLNFVAVRTGVEFSEVVGAV